MEKKRTFFCSKAYVESVILFLLLKSDSVWHPGRHSNKGNCKSCDAAVSMFYLFILWAFNFFSFKDTSLVRVQPSEVAVASELVSDQCLYCGVNYQYCLSGFTAVVILFLWCNIFLKLAEKYSCKV